MGILEKRKDLVATAVREALGWHLADLGVWAVTSTWDYSWAGCFRCAHWLFGGALRAIGHSAAMGVVDFVIAWALLVAGILLTILCKFVQFRMVGESIRVVMEKPATEGSVSSFGALMISTASRVGTGNIVGVSTAICLGGVGAVFWMWFIAIFGGASAFVESTLAQIYKKKDTDGSSYGGPSYYMETALRQRWLGIIFAVIRLLST